MIEIRHAETGESKHFTDKQGVADFLAGRADAAQWEGVSNLGDLPAPNMDVATPAAAPPLTEPETPIAAPAAKPKRKPAVAKKAPAKKAAKPRRK